MVPKSSEIVQIPLRVAIDPALKFRYCKYPIIVPDTLLWMRERKTRSCELRVDRCGLDHWGSSQRLEIRKGWVYEPHHVDVDDGVGE